MTLANAKAAIVAGSMYGDAFEQLADGSEDRAELPRWYCHEFAGHAPEVYAARKAALAPVAVVATALLTPASLPESTGELCRRCGGLMVRTGTCYTCQSCGESSGGCG